MAAVIKALHLLLKTGWGGGDQSWQVTDAVSPLLIHLLTTSFEKKNLLVCVPYTGRCMYVGFILFFTFLLRHFFE